jgi:hypothetical protein
VLKVNRFQFKMTDKFIILELINFVFTMIYRFFYHNKIVSYYKINPKALIKSKKCVEIIYKYKDSVGQPREVAFFISLAACMTL